MGHGRSRKAGHLRDPGGKALTAVASPSRKTGRKSAGHSGTCGHIIRYSAQRIRPEARNTMPNCARVDATAEEQQMLDVTPTVCARISSTNTSVRLVQLALAQETCMGLTGSTTLHSDSPGG